MQTLKLVFGLHLLCLILLLFSYTCYFRHERCFTHHLQTWKGGTWQVLSAPVLAANYPSGRNASTQIHVPYLPWRLCRSAKLSFIVIHMSRVFLDFRGTGQGAHSGCYGPDQASGGVRLWPATCQQQWGRPCHRPEQQQRLEETKAWRYLLQETAGQPWFHMLPDSVSVFEDMSFGPIWLRALLLPCLFDDCTWDVTYVSALPAT